MFTFFVALLALAATSTVSLAQQVDFSTFKFFEGDSTDVNASALARLADTMRRANVPDGCPLGRLRIRVAEGDPLFQEALAQARRDAILGRLNQMGIPVAGRLFVETSIFGTTEGDDATYEIPTDRTPPTLQTNSTPPKRSKVSPNQRIAVRMIARDDAARWQTGIKTIQLVADSDGGRFIASENYQPCSDPKEKRVEATYAVPADPPPVVRLSAFAEDHAGNKSEIYRAEFPTGDFQGTFEFSTPPSMPVGTRARAEFVLNHDGRGNLTGTMSGTHEMPAAAAGPCSWRTIQPGRFRVSLTGAYTEGRSLKVFVDDVVVDAPLKYQHECSGTALPVAELTFKTIVWGAKPFLGTPSPLGEGELLGDGTRLYKAEMGASWTVKLRRAAN